MNMTLLSPPVFRSMAVTHRVRFGEEKNQGQNKGKTQETFSGDCGGACQGHCTQCATAARNREAAREKNEARRRLVAEKNNLNQ